MGKVSPSYNYRSLCLFFSFRAHLTSFHSHYYLLISVYFIFLFHNYRSHAQLLWSTLLHEFLISILKGTFSPRSAITLKIAVSGVLRSPKFNLQFCGIVCWSIIIAGRLEALGCACALNCCPPLYIHVVINTACRSVFYKGRKTIYTLHHRMHSLQHAQTILIVLMQTIVCMHANAVLYAYKHIVSV